MENESRKQERPEGQHHSILFECSGLLQIIIIMLFACLYFLFLNCCYWSPVIVDAAAYDPRTAGKTHPESFDAAPLISFDSQSPSKIARTTHIERGGGFIPAGWNPFGFKITALGEKFLEFDGSRDSDIGRFLASLTKRATLSVIKKQWLEVRNHPV